MSVHTVAVSGIEAHISMCISMCIDTYGGMTEVRRECNIRVCASAAAMAAA